MPDVIDHLPPDLLAELDRQYELVRPLGRGGMGVVWLARERSLDRQVAIKVLAGDAIADRELRERFRREARIAARLSHPNIVPLHTFGETPNALFFVMGYVDGETFAARLDREGRITGPTAVRILGEIADALAFAHAEGVVHRDVKPENILIDRKSGRAMLADFGIARVDSGATSVTMTGVAVGTPSYMSPEQAAGARDVDGRTDIYSLGVVAYRSLAGRLPFRSTTAEGLLSLQVAAKPDDLALSVPVTERALALVIMRALEKAPAERWTDAAEFRDELRRAARPDALPDALARVDGWMTQSVAITGLIILIYVVWFLFDPGPAADTLFDPVFRWMLLPGLLGFPLLSVWLGKPSARVFGWKSTLRTMLHPPQFWASWWPRSWRRQEDLWDRLPTELRRARIALQASAALLVGVWTLPGAALMLELNDVIAPWSGYAADWLALTVIFGPYAISIILVVYQLRRTIQRLGISFGELMELLAIPNRSVDPRWTKPAYARLLAPEAGAPAATSVPKTPLALAEAVGRLNRRLRDAGVLQDDESAQAARAVVATIDSLEQEIHRLHQELDPAERERLDRRLAALGGERDADLRGLLEGQRAILARVEDRSREAESRRDRLREQLVLLWTQLTELDALQASGAPTSSDVTDRLRAVCDDLARMSRAYEEANEMTRGRE